MINIGSLMQKIVTSALIFLVSLFLLWLNLLSLLSVGQNISIATLLLLSFIPQICGIGALWIYILHIWEIRVLDAPKWAKMLGLVCNTWTLISFFISCFMLIPTGMLSSLWGFWIPEIIMLCFVIYWLIELCLDLSQ